MKITACVFLLIPVLLTPLPCLAQTAPSSGPAAPSANQSEEATENSYHLVILPLQYRFVSTSGFAGRVGEYDSLQQSIGGDLTFTLIDHLRRVSWEYRANFLSGDDYDMQSQLRMSKYVTLKVDSRSLIRHLEDVPFGVNLSPDDMVRTESVGDSALFGIKRTRNNVNLGLKIPRVPIKFFVKGGWQARRGHAQIQYFDMGGDAGCGSCHSVSQFRTLNYTTRDVGFGAEVKLAKATLVFEHDFHSFVDRLQNPLDFFGSTLSLPGDELPAGVPDTLQGLYAHNIFSRHRSSIDTLRLNAPLSHSINFTGDISAGRTRNILTGNPQKTLNSDAALNWKYEKNLSTILDYHQQNTLNEFTPLYPLFANPSFHRYWLGARTTYRAGPHWELEAHYRRTDVTRTNADLFPQFYSPDNADLRRVIPRTFSNATGVSARYHYTQKLSVQSGYEWVGTHAPGYLTDPGQSHRTFATVTLAPVSRISLMNDFSILSQSNFAAIQRQNHLMLNTSYLTLMPISDWTVGVGYGYYQNNLRTDLIYGTDPFYQESLVPFKAISQSYSVSSTYLAKKRFSLRVDASHVASSSEFRPQAANDFFSTVFWASEFSRVAVPQATVGSMLDYRFAQNFTASIRFQYGSYIDLFHPEFTGYLRTYTLMVAKNW